MKVINERLGLDRKPVIGEIDVPEEIKKEFPKEKPVKEDGTTKPKKKTPKEIKEALAEEDEKVKVVDLTRPGRRPRLTKGT